MFFNFQFCRWYVFVLHNYTLSMGCEIQNLLSKRLLHSGYEFEKPFCYNFNLQKKHRPVMNYIDGDEIEAI